MLTRMCSLIQTQKKGIHKMSICLLAWTHDLTRLGSDQVDFSWIEST